PRLSPGRAHPLGAGAGGTQDGEAEPRVEVEGLLQLSGLQTNVIEPQHAHHDGADPITTGHVLQGGLLQASRASGAMRQNARAARMPGHRARIAVAGDAKGRNRDGSPRGPGRGLLVMMLIWRDQVLTADPASRPMMGNFR